MRLVFISTHFYLLSYLEEFISYNNLSEDQIHLLIDLSENLKKLKHLANLPLDQIP